MGRVPQHIWWRHLRGNHSFPEDDVWGPWLPPSFGVSFTITFSMLSSPYFATIGAIIDLLAKEHLKELIISVMQVSFCDVTVFRVMKGIDKDSCLYGVGEQLNNTKGS